MTDEVRRVGDKRDPEIRELQRESLRLIIQSEKVLTALEDHLALLRTFVQNARVLVDDTDTVHEHAHVHSHSEADDNDH